MKNRISHTRFFHYLTQKKEIVLLVVIGLVFLAFIDIVNLQRLYKDQDYRQTLIAQKLQAQLQSSLEEHVTALIALNVVYQNFVDISHYDFQQYGQSITASLQGFDRLMYITPDMAIRRVYPLTPDNSALFTQSLQQNPQLVDLLTRAKSQRQPTVSPLISFQGHPKSLLAVIPIYRSDNTFLGYAAGEISLQTICKPFSQAEFLSRYQVQIEDPTGTPFFSGIPLDDQRRILTQVPFKVGGSEWKLLLQPVQPTFEVLFLQRALFWLVGLLILSLVLLLITRSKRYKRYLNEAKHQFETIFNASPDGIVMLNDKLEFQLSNPPIEAWSGLSKSELAGQTFFNLFTCQCPHLNKCRELSFLLCTSEQFDHEFPEILEAQITHKQDNSTRTLRLNASRIDLVRSQDQAKGFICVLGDISTGKELERVKESYVATLTHDLKTPLIAQEMVLNTLLSGKAGNITPDQEKLLHGANDSVKDLLEMVNSTLLYYKLESSHLTLQKQTVPLEPLLKDVMETLKPLLERRHLSFQFETSLDLPPASVDPIQLKRVFHNILSNALSYAKRSSEICVTLQAESAERLLVIIRNQGKGIPEAELPKIFDKYYSLSRKFKHVGTGLGLYISRKIVELHGGKIWAESYPDGDTTFFISLPLPQKL